MINYHIILNEKNKNSKCNIIINLSYKYRIKKLKNDKTYF